MLPTDRRQRTGASVVISAKVNKLGSTLPAKPARNVPLAGLEAEWTIQTPSLPSPLQSSRSLLPSAN
jgi:hypothetical protein